MISIPKAKHLLAQAANTDAFIAAADTLLYHGCSVRETAGVAAVIRIWHGPTAGAGDLLESIALAANASFSIHRSQGAVAEKGISIERVSGTFDISVYSSKL